MASVPKAVLYFDRTKLRKNQKRHFSGLNRFSSELYNAILSIGTHEVIPVYWSLPKMSFVDDSGKKVKGVNSSSLFLSPEIFSWKERPGIHRWLKRFKGSSGVICHDAIPYFHPEITWGKSVRRFKHFLKAFKQFSVCFAVSEDAAFQLNRALQEQGLPKQNFKICHPGVHLPDSISSRKADPSQFLHVGILEPRKGQDLILDSAERLWSEGKVFKLVLAGRVNPEFGKPILDKIEKLQASGRSIEYIADASDEDLQKLYSRSQLFLFPSKIEGYGLPVLEAMANGCPVMTSLIPVYECIERRTGGFRILTDRTVEQWSGSMAYYLENPDELDALRGEISREQLPSWTETAEAVFKGLAR